MGWMDLLGAGIQATGQLGSGAIEGSFKSQQARIGSEGATTRSFMQEVAALGTSGWETVAGGYGSSQLLANQLGQQLQARTAIERAKVEAEASRKQTMLLVVLAGAALVVIAIVLLNRN
jgi:hypothetical protein